MGKLGQRFFAVGGIMRNQTFFSRQLEYFSVLYRLKNFSAAAKAIPITYQGLKKSINKLETELSTVLFMPGNGDSIEPTHSADALYDLITKWTDDLTALEKEMFPSAGNGARTLNVCACLGSVNTLGLSLFFQFEKANPDIRVNVAEYSDVLADESLLRGEYGIGFTSSPFNDDLTTIPLASFECAAWINKQHRLARRESISFEDLEGENLMIPNSQYKENAHVLQTLNTKGVHLKSKRYNNDPTWSRSFAEQGYGIGMSPRDPCLISQAEPTHESPYAVLVPIADGYLRTIGLSHRRGHLLTADEKLFWNHYKNACKKSAL